MTESHDYSTRRFLVVDDEPFMLSVLERMLRPFKPAAIHKASGGAEALRSIKDDLTQVDCIISDFNMKPVNGLQLLQAIRTGVNQRIPRDQRFIMLTGHGETDVVKAAIMLDVSAYLVKPVAPDKIAQTLDRILKSTVELKSVDYYRAVKVGPPPAPADQVKSPSAWVILGKQRAGAGRDALREKVERLRVEDATRDGIEEIKLKNRRQCDLGEMREGLILAEDIHAEEGAVLLRKGTLLTARMVDRLRELAVESGARSFVWVADPA